jgi:hypothetical protein
MPLFEPAGEITGDVGCAIVAEQPRPLRHRGAVAAGDGQGILERGRDIPGTHGGAQPPGNDVAAVIVEDRREIEPTPADDLQIGEVGLPELVRPGGLLVELICRADHGEGWAGDEVMCLQKPVDTGLGDEVALAYR